MERDLATGLAIRAPADRRIMAEEVAGCLALATAIICRKGAADTTQRREDLTGADTTAASLAYPP